MFRVSDGLHVINIECTFGLLKRIENVMEGYIVTDSDIEKKEEEFILKISHVEKNMFTCSNLHERELHCKKRGFVYREGKKNITIYNATDNVKIVVQDDMNISICGDSNNQEFICECVRLIRVCFEIYLLKKGYSKMHMCVLSKKGLNIGIVGDSGSGKTTMLLELVKRGFDICTNDKVLINSNNICYGICQKIGILDFTMEKFCIDLCEANRIGKKYYYWPIELAHKFRVKINNCCVINKILEVNYQNTDCVEITKIKSADYKRKIYDDAIRKYTDISCMNLVRDLIIRNNKIKLNYCYTIYDSLEKLPWYNISGEFEKIAME